jgi:hypothetical protein
MECGKTLTDNVCAHGAGLKELWADVFAVADRTLNFIRHLIIEHWEIKICEGKP